ncbi:hypothetical protein [Arcticibacter sp. MXS-1]|uniref:hypothetical protein n=1 Tax=Arcticibacter sp. MXS-1 TaxID=3341726 RepID=UPI0035A96992
MLLLLPGNRFGQNRTCLCPDYYLGRTLAVTFSANFLRPANPATKRRRQNDEAETKKRRSGDEETTKQRRRNDEAGTNEERTRNEAEAKKGRKNDGKLSKNKRRTVKDQTNGGISTRRNDESREVQIRLECAQISVSN